jgi:ribosome-associated protein
LSRESSGTEAVLTAAAASASKKAMDIIILDVSARLVITDHFLICSGNTDRQVRTIAEEVERRMGEEMGRKPVRREGMQDGRWVVLDFIDFVVHVFRKEEREYYELERLWSDVPVVPFHDEHEERNEPAAAEAT